MNILNKIINTKITRTPNKLILKVFPMWAIMLVYALVYLSVLTFAFYLSGWSMVLLFFLGLVVLTYSFEMVSWLVHKVHSYDLIITGNEEQKAIIPKVPSYTNIVIRPPFFIDMFVTSEGENIKVLIEFKGQKLGLFRLASANDLSVIIDSFMELLEVELVDSYKLSNKELLSFKSKQKAIAPYSAIQIMELQNNLTIRSIVKKNQKLEFNFIKKQIKNDNQTIDFTTIQQIIIVSHKEQQQVAIKLKNGQQNIIFKNKTTEITAIRDAKRLKAILEKQPELSKIKIEMIN
ncbi:MAG: hypothetical protein AB8G11_14140 [Saprospiraceae bacterium]